MYYQNAKAIILVVDSHDVSRFHVIKQELFKMVEHDHLRKAVILVFANKQDLNQAMTPTDISNALSLCNLKERPWHIQGCCALTGQGLEEGMNWLVDQIS
jgi:ADP-ribosylation factor-like protein 5B